VFVRCPLCYGILDGLMSLLSQILAQVRASRICLFQLPFEFCVLLFFAVVISIFVVVINSSIVLAVYSSIEHDNQISALASKGRKWIYAYISRYSYV